MGNSASQFARRQYPSNGSLKRPSKSPVTSESFDQKNGNNGSVLKKLASSDLDNDEQKDIEFGSVLDKLGGAITGRTLPNDEGRIQDPLRHRPAQPSGRLKLPIIRSLLYEHENLIQQNFASVEEVQQLATRYAVDHKTLDCVLKYNKLPCPHAGQST